MTLNQSCSACGRNGSVRWWKCCPKHTTERGPDVLCQACAEKLHSKEYLGCE